MSTRKDRVRGRAYRRARRLKLQGDFFDELVYNDWRTEWLMMWGIVGFMAVYNYSTAATAQNFAALTGTPRVHKGIVLP